MKDINFISAVVGAFLLVGLLVWVVWKLKVSSVPFVVFLAGLLIADLAYLYYGNFEPMIITGGIALSVITMGLMGYLKLDNTDDV